MRGQANVYPAGATQVLTPNTVLTYAKAFYLVKAAPVRLGLSEAILEVWLATEARGWRLRAVNRVYNVLNGDKTAFVSGASSTSSANTYGTVITDLASDAGATIGALPFTPVAKPHNLFLEYIPVDEALRRALRPLSLVLVADPFASSTAITYTIVQLDYTSTTQRDDIEALMAVAGQDGCNSGRREVIGASMAPASLKIVFPKWPITPIEWTATSLTAWSKYTEITSSSPLTTGGGTGADAIFVGDHFDVASKAYTETLADIAAERATAYWNRVGIQNATYLLVGGYPLIPGKTTRRVRVSMDQDGWFTTVTCHSFIDNGPRADAMFAGAGGDNNLSARFPEHAAGSSSGMFPRDDGTVDMLATNAIANGAAASTLEVDLVRNGGADGETFGTYPTYLYDVYEKGHSGEAAFKLATAAEMEWHRYQDAPHLPATNGRGYKIGAVFHLSDGDEYSPLVNCAT